MSKFLGIKKTYKKRRTGVDTWFYLTFRGGVDCLVPVTSLRGGVESRLLLSVKRCETPYTSQIMGMTSAGGRVDDWLQKLPLCQRLWPRFLMSIFLIGLTSYAVFTIANFPISTFEGSLNSDRQLSGCNCLEDEWSSFDEVKLDRQRIFYNRVPKCASTTLYTLMRKLSIMNNYVHYNSKVYDKKMISEEEQSRFVHHIKSTAPPCTFDRHIFFVNFTRFDESSPIYINLIRDPVERIISSYYYRRLAARLNHGRTAKPSNYWLNKKFRHCVMNSDPECSFIDGQSYGVLLLPYFCGQDKRCLILNNPWALQKAKNNIERYYAVVGVVEELNITLRVLEASLPRFFKGAVEVYNTLSVRKNQNHQKEHVAEDLKAALKANLTSEYELYHFVVQRLYRQYRELQLNLTI